MSLVLKTAIVGALQRVPAGEKPHLGSIRKDVSIVLRRDITPVELRQALEALYFKGVIDHRLNLIQPHTPAASGTAREAPGGTVSAVPMRDPVSAAPFSRRLIDLRHAPSSMEEMAASWRRKAAAS